MVDHEIQWFVVYVIDRGLDKGWGNIKSQLAGPAEGIEFPDEIESNGPMISIWIRIKPGQRWPDAAKIFKDGVFLIEYSLCVIPGSLETHILFRRVVCNRVFKIV